MSELLRPDLVKKLRQLRESVFRPPQIVALEALINGEVRALQVREIALGPKDEEAHARRVAVVQQMHLLDTLYVEWARQVLASERLPERQQLP